jgi:superfamily II DNA or RNA helicase
VEQIEHGREIKEMAEDIFGETIPFIQGVTEDDTRAEVKKALSEKDEKIVICTSVWREGVDLPSLDNVFLASPHKSSKMVLQGIGRGLRKSEGKDTVTIWDFLDPYRYLAEHCVARIQMYVERGWM